MAATEDTARDFDPSGPEQARASANTVGDVPAVVPAEGASDSSLADSDRKAKVDRGLLPAETVPELVSAVCQNLHAAAVDIHTLVIELDNWNGGGNPRSEAEQQAREALSRLSRHLMSVDEKLTAALETARR